MQIQQAKPGYKHINIIHNIYHEVPEDWQIRNLGSFAKEINQRYLKGKDGPVLSVTKHRGFVKSLEYFKRQIYSKDIKNYKLVEKGDFAYATIHLDEGSLGLLKEFDRGYISPMYTAFRIDSSLDSDFLYLLLRSTLYLQTYNAIGEGSINRRKSISFDNLSQLNIPMPSLKEQKKISLIICNIDNLILNIHKSIEQTQRLKKGLMQKLLTKGIGHTKFKKTTIGELPEEWEISTIGKECKVGTGGTPSRTKPDYFRGNIPWIKTTEINFNLIRSADEYITKQALEESSAKLYPSGTLLMAMYGQGVTRGKSAILGIEAAINQACAAIQSLGREHIPFLFYWCQIQYGNLRSKSQGTHQSNFNLNFVKSIKIPCPPLIEQKNIESILSKVDSMIQLEQDTKLYLKRLKEGLMQKLLTGKIRVKV